MRLGVATGVLAGASVVGRALWDKGGFGAVEDTGTRQVRDYRVAGGLHPSERLELAVAKGAGGAPRTSSAARSMRSAE